MSKKKYEQYRKEFKNRSAKIPWKYYVQILEEEFGITEQKRSHSGGSKRSFLIGDSMPFVIHEPHGKDDPVGQWDHKNVLNLLMRAGVIEDEYEED